MWLYNVKSQMHIEQKTISSELAQGPKHPTLLLRSSGVLRNAFDTQGHSKHFVSGPARGVAKLLTPL